MLNKILKRLKSTSDYISGAQLGEEMGVSRAAIWKGVKRLRQDGYEIEAVNNRGYRLINGRELYNKAEIEYALSPQYFGHPLYFYDETDSTNLAIRRLSQEGAPEGTLAVAQSQSAGRGRLGRQWIGVPGTGIWMSLLLRPKVRPTDTPVLTLLAGLAVCRAIIKNTGLLAEIKWPNDILINGRKVCGILTEMDGEMDCVRSVILGIGINVNNTDFEPELADIATSLKNELKTNDDIERIPLLDLVLKEFEDIYIKFLPQWDFVPFLSDYKRLCHTLNKDIQVLGCTPFNARAVDITPNGELVVEDEAGARILVNSGEVSIRLNAKH